MKNVFKMAINGMVAGGGIYLFCHGISRIMMAGLDAFIQDEGTSLNAEELQELVKESENVESI